MKRRQEILINTPKLTVIEDFGHHPTALAETLHSFRARFKGAVLTAVFEPRSNTARTSTLQGGFARAWWYFSPTAHSTASSAST